MSQVRPLPPPASAARLLGIIRWLLPLVLAAVAVLLEWREHIAVENEEFTPGFLTEVALFGVGGPVVVALTLRWLAHLVAAYQATSAALAVTNRDLEAKITERTEHLRTASFELATANAELERANGELRQVDRLKSEFVSLVSHQLRAPLTNINGALEIVAQDADLLPPTAQRTLEILGLESRRLSRLIRTILDVSRLEAGRLALHLGPVAIEPLLARTCSSTLAVEVGRTWTISVPEALPPAWADEVLLEEIIRNLLENAMHYSAAGTAVEVSVKEVDGMLEISVADHGSGVPPAERAKIFGSFHRLNDDETSVKGSGLGLYFADKLVRAQGGAIDVESPIWPDAAAPGSRFMFTIPIADDEPDEDAEPHDGAEMGEED